MGASKHNFIINQSEIKDFDVDGYENVPSEDFDPGFGCVPQYVPRELKPPPPVPDNFSAVAKANIAYEKLTEKQITQKEDEFLKQLGL